VLTGSTPPLDQAAAMEYVHMFKALAHPARIRIVSLLTRERGPMAVGEIVTAVQLAQSTVSVHLQVLADAGFLLRQHRGAATYYRLNDTCRACLPAAAAFLMGQTDVAPPVCRHRHSRGAVGPQP
jgi:ArsR family transcriptional regulator, arsenate/arsenite/antimonite-responsive transcriptional repressor